MASTPDCVAQAACGSSVDGERRIILIGKIGAGKSHAGNAILDKNIFFSKKSWRSVTEECTYGTADKDGIKYKVYDTPGALNPKDKKKFPQEVVNCLLCTAPGFHSLTLVISTGERVTEADIKMYETLEKELGDGYENHLMIIFTKSDTIEEVNKLVASGDCEEIQRIVRKVKERYVCFGDNKEKVEQGFVDTYSAQLDEMMKVNTKNKREYYTHQLYNKVQEFLNKEADKIQRKDGLLRDNAMEIARERAMHNEIEIPKEILKQVEGCCTIL